MSTTVGEVPLTLITLPDGTRMECARGEEWIAKHNRESLVHVPDPLRHVVDIGAHVGFTALPAARRGAHVIAIEANPWTFATLCRNVQRNALCDRVTPIHAAVVTCPAVPMQLAELRSRFRNIGAAGLVQPMQQPVVGRALSMWWYKIPAMSPHQIDYLKMDIEGYEHTLIPEMINWIAGWVRYLALEIHDVENRPAYHADDARNVDLVTFLATNGFERVTGTEQLWRNTRQLAEVTA